MITVHQCKDSNRPYFTCDVCDAPVSKENPAALVWELGEPVSVGIIAHKGSCLRKCERSMEKLKRRMGWIDLTESIEYLKINTEKENDMETE